MRGAVALSALGLSLLLTLDAQTPFIQNRGISNAASYTSPFLPNGAIAQGSIFSIFGMNLGPAQGAQVRSFPLDTTFQGVSIEVRQGTDSTAAIPIYVSAGQVNAIMPSNAPTGRVSVKLTYNGNASNPVSAVVAKNGVGIFSVASSGLGPGVVQNFNSQTDQPVNSTRTAAKPGQTVILWATGLGPGLNPDNIAPASGSLPTQVEVFVGGISAHVAYSGRSPCCSGLDEIVFAIPSDAPSGCWVPVQVRTAGTTLSNTVTIAVSPQGAACSDSSSPLSSSVIAGGNAGVISLERHDIIEDTDVSPPVAYTTDWAAEAFGKNPGGPFAYNGWASLPPQGSCATFSYSGQLVVPSPRPTIIGLATGSSGGTAPDLTISNNSATAKIATADAASSIVLGSSDNPAQPLFLGTGTVNVSGAATGATGAFQTAVSSSPSMTWTNRSDVAAITRTQSLNLSWTASGAATVIIQGAQYDQPLNQTTGFLCTAPASAGTFTVPAYILSILTPSRPLAGRSQAYIMLGAIGAPSSFSATGLDAGFVVPSSWSDRSVVIQ